MRPVLIYSHADEPITNVLFSSEFDQKFNMVKLSLDTLLKDTIIFDEFDESEVKIEWTLSSGLKIFNSKDYYIINRILSIPETLFQDFSEEDRNYSLSEFRSYLAFAIEAFPHCFSKPGAFGLSGNRFSLPRQWEIIKKSNLSVKVPNYYLGNIHYCSLAKNIIYSEPFNYYYWKSNEKIKNASFAFEKPEGKPIIACIIGDEIEVFPHYTSDNLSIKDIKLAKEQCRALSKLFDYPIAECLFFLDDLKANFGMISNIPYASRKKKWFSGMINSFFTEIMGKNGKC